MEERASGSSRWLEDVLARELHLARLHQQSIHTTGVGPEVGAGAIGLQRALRRIIQRVEAIGVQYVEDLGGDAELLLAEGVEGLGQAIVEGQIAVGAVVVS